MIDADKSGTITAKEFAAALRRKGNNLPEEEVQQLVQDADIDGDGTIDYHVRACRPIGGWERAWQPARGPWVVMTKAMTLWCRDVCWSSGHVE